MTVAARSGHAFGVDIGGTGIKGAVVDTTTGELATERKRILTPQPATPDAVARVVAQLVADARWQGDIGATFPAVIKHGVAQSAANVDHAWVGTDADKVFTDAVGKRQRGDRSQRRRRRRASPRPASARPRASRAW